jgi:hypothetical protein
MKKCTPGVICVENVTIFLLFIIISVLGFFIYINLKQNNNSLNNNGLNNTDISIRENSVFSGYSFFPGNLEKDVLLNPYEPPYKDERYYNISSQISSVPINAVPINMSTNIGAVPINASYRQMGIITPLNGDTKDNILPLMGKPVLTNRDKWQYYTISNQHNNVKLPISVKGKSALTDYGVDQIYSGDTVYVEGYNDAFKVTVYENDTMRYLPFL